jgi:hypothetical protein
MSASTCQLELLNISFDNGLLDFIFRMDIQFRGVYFTQKVVAMDFHMILLFNEPEVATVFRTI